MSRTVRARTCVLLLLVLLACPVFARSAAPRVPAPPAKEQSFVVRLWHALGELVPAIGKSRGTMDPNGAPPASPQSTPPPPTSDTDSRGTMDPDG